MPVFRLWDFVLVVSCFCFVLHAVADRTVSTEVSALQSVRGAFIDPFLNLKNWNKGDPCVDNWTGVVCFDTVGDDGYLHVRELHMLNMNLSGTLSPELGKLSHLEILDVMWNHITGTIPKEIGNMSSLRILVLNGNNLSGSLPDELGYLSNLNRLQVDENNLTGPIPKSFAKMFKLVHLHMNNNSISGQLPHELSSLPRLFHLLVDNNNLSGSLPSEYSNLTVLSILQLDNNQLVGAEIPESFGSLSNLVKLSLRNCSLGGTLPDLSKIANLSYVDVSRNQLTGPISSAKLSNNITTIDFSHNNLNGSVPSSFSLLPRLQILSLENNSFSGSIPSSIWRNRSSSPSSNVIIDLRYNLLSNISGDVDPPENVTLRFRGNPLCNNSNIENISNFCATDAGGEGASDEPTNSTTTCPVEACPTDSYYEYVPAAPGNCYCAAPIRVGYRLKSPSFAYFYPHIHPFEVYVTSSLNLDLYELVIDSYQWEKGPRLRMYLKIFPMVSQGHEFNESEVERIKDIFATWEFPGSNFFGPYELLNFTLLGPYALMGLETGAKGVSKGVLAAILVGAIAGAVVVSTIVTLVVIRRRNERYSHMLSKERSAMRVSIKIDGVREFSFKEMAMVTDNFNSSAQVGRGGYGKVYKGVLSDCTAVAIKRAEGGSFQGKREFFTEIQLLSRLHHLNLVKLLGYCGEEGEQMLIYEFMPNGTLRDWLSGKFGKILSFGMRLKIALGSSKGILYLHTEANPPIFHRDIKASNILLDSHMTAKVADFGLSRLAPVLDDEGYLPNHVSTVVKGTPGYLDPEYFLTHNLTDKSDVYSLGVVFLELLTGQPPITRGKNLVREVNMAYKSGEMSSIIDSQMGGDYPAECMDKLTVLALRCVEDTPEMRPSMWEVVRDLEIILQLAMDSGAASGLSSSWYSESYSASSSSANNTTGHMNIHSSSDVLMGSNLTSGTFSTVVPR